MRRILLGVAVASLMGVAQAEAAGNLISNGSFESGTLDWTYVGSTPLGAPAVVIPYNSGASYPGGAYGEPIPPDNSLSASPDPVGSYALYLVADAATESLSQSVFLNPGLYTIGFSVYVPLNGKINSGDATFTGTVAGVNLAFFNVDSAPAQQWMHFAGVANIAAAGNYLTSFTYNSGPAPAGDFVVDRAYIVAGDKVNPVPEPATWALMIMGFGAAGAMLRRRAAALA